MGHSFNDLRRCEGGHFAAKRAELQARQGARHHRATARDFEALGFDATDSAVLASMPRRERSRIDWR